MGWMMSSEGGWDRTGGGEWEEGGSRVMEPEAVGRR
jgi:hypothetical protein